MNVTMEVNGSEKKHEREECFIELSVGLPVFLSELKNSVYLTMPIIIHPTYIVVVVAVIMEEILH